MRRSWSYICTVVGGASFIVIWIVVAVLMGLDLIAFFDRWEGKKTFMTAVFMAVPFGMAGIGVMVLVMFLYSALTGAVHSTLSPADGPPMGVPDPSSEGQGDRSGRAGEEVVIPDHCDACGTRLHRNEVDWTGPLTFRCPRCGRTIHAEYRLT